MIKPNDWSPQFFHQKGWIGTKFQVKNPHNATMRYKKRNPTETNLHDPQHLPLSPHKKQRVFSTELHKPLTAPDMGRPKVEIVENLEKMGSISHIWQEPPIIAQSRYSNFRTTLFNRKQLLYLKPYTRFLSHSLTNDEKKAQIYKQINHPDVQHYFSAYQNNCKPFEYLTEYKELFSAKQQPKPKHNLHHRTSLNIIRQKLKRKYETSVYKNKINAMKAQ